MTALAESQRSRRPLLEVLAVELGTLLRQCIERSPVGLAFIGSMLSAHLAVAQAPPSPGQPWAIPESASRRAAALGDSSFAVPHKQYGLAALVDLAEREHPNTRAAC